MKYHVLSLDGGGIRGLITVILLQRLSKEPAIAGWLDKVDLVAGTSTGGLLSLAIAKGLDLQVIRELYENKGPEIFDDSWLDDVIDLGTLIGAEYDNTVLKQELRKILGYTRLGQLHRHVLITAFDLDNEDQDPAKRKWKPKLFHNVPGTDNDADYLAYKVGLYTSAAPTYFPAVDGFIDGGVYANNPSMCALAQTQDSRNDVPHPLDEIVLLSLGTGTSLTYIQGKDLDWGYAQWIKPLINLMLDGIGGIADYQCKQILGNRYHRLGPEFPHGISIQMDDADRMDEMIDFAQGVAIGGTVAWLKAHWI